MSKYASDLSKYLKTQHIDCHSVLDIGGGVQYAKDRIGSCKCEEYIMIDNGNEKEWHDKWNEPDINVDINNRGMWRARMESKLEGNIDVLFCLEVFEYILDPMQLVEDISYCLKKDGIAYISLSEKYPVHNPIKSDVTRVTKQWMIIMAEQYSLEILECIPRRYSPEAFQHIQEAWRIDGLRAAKHYPDHDVVGYIFKLKKK